MYLHSTQKIKDNVPLLRLLLEYGANPNLAYPISNRTPLMHFLKQFEPNPEIIELLLNFGANPNYSIQYTSENGEIEYFTVLDNFLYYLTRSVELDSDPHEHILKIAKLLKEYGLATSAKNVSEKLDKHEIGFGAPQFRTKLFKILTEDVKELKKPQIVEDKTFSSTPSPTKKK